MKSAVSMSNYTINGYKQQKAKCTQRELGDTNSTTRKRSWPCKGSAVIRHSWSDEKITQMTTDCAISSNLCLILTNIEKSEVQLRTRTVSRIPDDPKERNTSDWSAIQLLGYRIDQKCRAWRVTKNRLRSNTRGRKVQPLRADTQRCTDSNGTVARISCVIRTFQSTQYFLSFRCLVNFLCL